jgi:hypothetical protein
MKKKAHSLCAAPADFGPSPLQARYRQPKTATSETAYSSRNFLARSEEAALVIWLNESASKLTFIGCGWLDGMVRLPGVHSGWAGLSFSSASSPRFLFSRRALFFSAPNGAGASETNGCERQVVPDETKTRRSSEARPVRCKRAPGWRVAQRVESKWSV